MKSTIKVLAPVYRAYVSTVINAIRQMPGILSVRLDSESQYDFVFTVEYASEEEFPGIMMRIKPLPRLSVLLSCLLIYGRHRGIFPSK